MALRLLFIACTIWANTINAQAQTSYCFQSTDGNKLNLKFTLIDKDWKYGYVRYNAPEYGIVIRQKYNRPLPSYPGLKEYMWEELRNDDSVTGTYQFIIQEETITNIIYTRAIDKKQFKFANKNVGIRDCECDW